MYFCFIVRLYYTIINQTQAWLYKIVTGTLLLESLMHDVIQTGVFKRMSAKKLMATTTLSKPVEPVLKPTLYSKMLPTLIYI